MDEPLGEATARAINAEPWQPMPGMVKRQCPECRYWFATWPQREQERCPDCASAGARGVECVTRMTS
jgi:hypothetical protein